MWLLTKHGMYSVVSPDPDSTDVVVRARVRKDLERLLRAFPETPRGKFRILKTENRDYGYRVIMPKADFTYFAFALASEIDYTNFKAEVARTDPRRAALYEQIWGILLRLQKFGWWSQSGVDSFSDRRDDPFNAARSRDFQGERK